MVTLAGGGLINQKQVDDKKINCIRGLAWTRRVMSRSGELVGRVPIKKKNFKGIQKLAKTTLWRRIDDNWRAYLRRAATFSMATREIFSIV